MVLFVVCLKRHMQYSSLFTVPGHRYLVHANTFMKESIASMFETCRSGSQYIPATMIEK